MCGLSGIVDHSEAPDPETITAMTACLEHRGPDAVGFARSGPFACGHTRLSILDLSERGSQPMWSVDGRYCLAYNGELYNAPELRRELRRHGRLFRGHSDTEVMLESLCEWGVPALERFNGMFAFALWDDKLQQLTLARDRFGIKPLYYAHLPHGVAFGSEVKALIKSQRVTRNVDASGLHEFLYYGNALGRNTLFLDVRRVLPGEWLQFRRGGHDGGRYWTPRDVVPILDSPSEASATIRDELAAAVKRHLLSDVPVAALLSGGVDSSAVVAFAARASERRLQTFTVGFDLPGAVNEFAKARLVASEFGTDHSELFLRAASVPDLLRRLVESHDQPFGDAANVPLLMMAEALCGRTKVILQGDGGDEIFGGYRRYNMLALARALGGRLAPSSAVPMLPNGKIGARINRLTRALSEHDPALRMALLLTQEGPSLNPTVVLRSELRAQIASADPFERYRIVATELGCSDPVQAMLLTDTSILLPDILLEKVDRPMMAHGIEVRVPLLDAELTAYVLGLPSRYKIRHFQKKWIFKKALEGVLPGRILNARKMGFGVPYSQWLRGPLVSFARERLLGNAGLSLFDSGVMGRLLDEHIAGSADNGFLLYKCLNLALWREMYLDGHNWSIVLPTGPKEW